MDLTLSWDLFVIVFFGLVISYSFIIGKHESVKIIVFTYIAIVTGQAMGNMIQELSRNSEPLLNSFGLSIDITVLDSTKMVIFIGTIILLAIRGGFVVKYNNEASQITNTILTGAFGFATAGLLLSTLLNFVAGTPLLESGLTSSNALTPIIEQSKLVFTMVQYQDAWFCLPALLLIAVGVMSNK